MNELVDTHCHLHDRSAYNYAFSRQQISEKLLREFPDLPRKPEDFAPEKMLERARASGVTRMICVGTSHDDSLRAQEFAEAHEGVFWSYGIHPDEAEAGENSCSLALIPSKLVAIGEVGLDYHNGESQRKAQIQLFERVLQLAKDKDLPLIFHVREAFSDFFAVLDNFPEVRGVVHSFSDSPENLEKSLQREFYIGVNGLATFAPELPLPPLEKMLLETDAPFLTPAPFRGTINESAHIKEICAYISNVKGAPEAQVAQMTTKNAERLFKI